MSTVADFYTSNFHASLAIALAQGMDKLHVSTSQNGTMVVLANPIAFLPAFHVFASLRVTVTMMRRGLPFLHTTK
uniref:hypothetical protein n=1 Tax=Laribacter hongkongensis TaxID=168471 RepID=UPI0004825946|nr:hypothetical protein [Laribacter hongkongensis]